MMPVVSGSARLGSSIPLQSPLLVDELVLELLVDVCPLELLLLDIVPLLLVDELPVLPPPPPALDDAPPPVPPPLPPVARW
jgi:hypothetical protein